MPKSSFLAGLSLSAAQLGDATGARQGRGGGAGGGRRAVGKISAMVQRAASEVASTEQLLLVKHKILGPTPPSEEALRSALRDPELRHRILLISQMVGSAPLVTLECVDDDDDAVQDGGNDDHLGDAPGSRGEKEDATPPPVVHVIMQKSKYERAGRKGGRFVVFAPWTERAGNPPTLIAAHVEALPMHDGY